MKKVNWLGILGFAAMAVGFVAELVQGYVDEKSTEKLIDEKINEALMARQENN